MSPIRRPVVGHPGLGAWRSRAWRSGRQLTELPKSAGQTNNARTKKKASNMKWCRIANTGIAAAEAPGQAER